MAKKTRKMEEILSIHGETVKVVSYADYFARIPLFSSLQIKNDGEETLTGLFLCVKNENGMLLPCEKELEIPFESVVKVDLGDLLSPFYFSNIESVQEEIITVTLKKDKKDILQQSWSVTALPFDFWQGTEGNAELLASFVRPKLGDCARVQKEIAEQLKKWDSPCELGGYVGNDKNTIRKIAAAAYAVLRRYSLTKKEQDISQPVEAGAGVKLLTEKKASPLELALFVCGCLESLGLHSVLVYGKKEITCGVWLYDSCFVDTVSDDMGRLGAYVEDGINNLTCFDIEDVFSDKNAAYSTSETHFKQKLAEGYYDGFVDICRCRMSNIRPLPLRAKSVKGYELLSEVDMSPDAAPSDLREVQKLSLDGELTKAQQWERRLLDFSLKNTLLNFLPMKGGVRLHTISADQVLDTLSQQTEIALYPASEVLTATARKECFGVNAEVKRMRELIELENKSGILRTYNDQASLNERLGRLMRKNKEAHEEAGAKILYLALGFLKWYPRDSAEACYAPLVLAPVQIKRSKGGAGYALSLSDEEISVNSTLLEFLKQEFNIDIRGLGDAIQGLKISEILAMVRVEMLDMRNWEVVDDAYLAAFSFSRYQMWNDLRQNITAYSQNKIIDALLNNSIFVSEGGEKSYDEDEVRPQETLTPLQADSSQWGAIAQSKTGSSFVLHGPPGTGKSQTITNIIANALHDGRSVLFVAEKQAALSVVKKRLDGIGLGEFCLELHSNKTSKTEVLQKLQSTLSLTEEQERTSLAEGAELIVRLRKELAEPTLALHKKRRLGVSVYEALLIYLKNKHAPDIMNIESSFYDGLTKEKIDNYEQMMIQSAAAAKECGGVYNSPFSNVNLTEYDLPTRDLLYCASEVMLAEIKHLRSYIALFLDLYRQNISTLTRTKLEALVGIAKRLQSGALNKYFKENEEEFFAFFNANKRLDACLEKYKQSCKKLVELGKEYKELGEWLDGGNTDPETDKTVKTIVKKLRKIAVRTLGEEEILPLLGTVYEIYESMEQIRSNTRLSSYFTLAFGRVDFFDARKHFLKDLYELHEQCASVFLDYNPDSFNSTCLRASGGCTAPVLEGLYRSGESFQEAEKSFLTVTNADLSKLPSEEILDFYVAKASALIENIDMLASWTSYKKTAKLLDEAGLTFITAALENGAVTSENIIESFEKNIYKNFLQTAIPLDPTLSRFSAAVSEERAESLRLEMDEFSRLTKEYIRSKLLSKLADGQKEGTLALELACFQRLYKSNLRGMGLRRLFEETPALMKAVAPCMLMSPITVSQYLPAVTDLFDLVVFDEASQIPTAEAICAIARGKSAIIVGDPKQLPPTRFFTSNYVDEDNLENEDMESLLDDCLAISMPQRYLTWHYRSKHESLIAFSNAMYYENRLCTFPSPDGLASKVGFHFVEDGTYDRGLTKRNKAEVDALVAEVIRRLADSKASKQSLGIVTFSNVQKEYIERRLTTAIAEKRLESVAYDREEPLFVKNLENVQGDERDVILFSVCYGPDKFGKLSMNFGPLNQAGGWRRLNVAVSRAREEMMVFSSITGAMIDLSKTRSRGVMGLKAFLDFAQKGRTNLAIASEDIVRKKEGLGKYIAEDLAVYGYDCRYDVGASGFKIDVAVIDPKDRKRFLLAILCDTSNRFSVKDRTVLQVQTLKRNNWNVLRLYAVNYYNNPKREIKKIKDLLDKLTGADKKGGTELNRYKKPYKKAVLEEKAESANYITSGENDKEILARLKAIVAVEEPISYEFLVRRCLSSLGVTKYGAKVEGRMQTLIGLCGFKYEKVLGRDFYRKTDKCISFERYRVETGEILRKNEGDFTPYEIISIVRGALEDKVALYMDEILLILSSLLRLAKPTDKFIAFVNDCITLGEEKGLFVRSVSDRISLA